MFWYSWLSLKDKYTKDAFLKPYRVSIVKLTPDDEHLHDIATLEILFMIVKFII